jgi:hypothetical protein
MAVNRRESCVIYPARVQDHEWTTIMKKPAEIYLLIDKGV